MEFNKVTLKLYRKAKGKELGKMFPRKIQHGDLSHRY